MSYQEAEQGIRVSITDLPDRPRTKIILIEGSLEARSIQSLNRAVLPLLQSGIVNLVFDCAGLRFVTSPALGVLINYFKRAREQGGTTKYYGLHEHIPEIFRIVGLTRTFEIYQTEDEALASMPPA